jgi:hypothetical protein
MTSELHEDVKATIKRFDQVTRETLHSEMTELASRYKVTVAEVYVIYYTIRAEERRTIS